MAYSGATQIMTERNRTILHEGYDDAHDDQHTAGELSAAAVAHIRQAATILNAKQADQCLWWLPAARACWPFNDGWKPTDDPIKHLVQAGQFITAEIDRLQRQRDAWQGVDPHSD